MIEVGLEEDVLYDPISGLLYIECATMTDEKEIIQALIEAADINYCYILLLEDLVKTGKFDPLVNEHFNNVRSMLLKKQSGFLGLHSKLTNQIVQREIKPEIKIEVKSEVTNTHYREIDLT